MTENVPPFLVGAGLVPAQFTSALYAQPMLCGKGEDGNHDSLSFGEGRGEAFAGSDRLESVAWWDGNSHDETKPVGLKAPNALGLFDMSGNEREWCADWLDKDFYKKCAEKGSVVNPRNDEVGSYRVLRGGSWIYDFPQYCRVANRSYDDPSNRSHFIGLRLAASPPGSVEGL